MSMNAQVTHRPVLKVWRARYALSRAGHPDEPEQEVIVLTTGAALADVRNELERSIERECGQTLCPLRADFLGVAVNWPDPITGERIQFDRPEMCPRCGHPLDWTSNPELPCTVCPRCKLEEVWPRHARKEEGT